MADISHIRIGQLVRDIKDAAARLLIANLQLALNSLTSRVETAEGKLAGIQSGAQVNILETVKVNGTALSVTDKAVDVTVPSYSDATTSASGLMSAADKTKLNGIATGATKVIVDSALDGTSTNPVENQAVHSALAGKAAASHTHDDRYYTESETDTLLNGKSNTGHTHDDRYYTESETDTLLSGKSDTGHTHDDRYYTETETDGLLNGKSNTGHTHDDRYYTESEVDTALSGKSNTGHDHDDRYYTETEMDTALAGKVAKAGDTMTGTLIQKTTLDTTTHPAADTTISGLQFQDENGVAMGNLNIRQNANGASGVYLHTRRDINGTIKSHSLLLLMDDSGSRTVEFSEVAPWRNALGLGNTSGALPIANGGTGATTKANAKTALDIDDLEDSIGTFKTVTKTLNANSNVTFTFDGFCSFCVLISGSVVGVRCILMGHCSTAGNVVVSKYSFGSTDNITTDVSATNKLKISNAASNAGYVRLIRVSSSGTMPT